jgi:hypothetical protein
MNPHCGHCRYIFERGPGYFLGSMYINYGVTAGVMIPMLLGLMFWTEFAAELIIPLLLAFCLTFPVWFSRYARCLWMAFDLAFDPPEETEFASEER